ELQQTLKYNDINALNSSSETLLHVAAANGHLTIMEYLISKGAKIDVKDKKGRTPLHGAAEKGHGDAVKVLLRCDLSSDIMESALFRAVQENLHGIVAALIDRGTDINAYNEMQYTPLLLACETGKAESAEVLIEKGADFSIKTPASDTALHLAVQAGAASIANLLLRKGIEINLMNQANETPLHIAALHNKGALAGLLVNAGAKINAVTKEFVTPLHIASQRGNTDVAQQLLYHKANVNVKDKESKTPLHFAAERGDKAMVEMLLNANADPNAQDKEKKTPLHTHLPANLCVWGCSALDLLDSLPMLINPIGRLGINQREEQRVPKTLLTRCCFQDTVRCYTDIQYLAGPSLDISVLYPMTWY
uniref:Uncharacterized protein n=1 Tax=Aquila chrysaetos chrysaetos TaxID=223781 RepID=A0A663FLQ4_AQUCH